ncbi:MAG: hypothetical protein ACE5G5_04750 [Candidatus Methylomirabilales bacterium]
MSKVLGVAALALVLGVPSIPFLGMADAQGPMARCPIPQCGCVQSTTTEKWQPAPERAPDPVFEQQDFLFPEVVY